MVLCRSWGWCNRPGYRCEQSCWSGTTPGQLPPPGTWACHCYQIASQSEAYIASSAHGIPATKFPCITISIAGSPTLSIKINCTDRRLGTFSHDQAESPCREAAFPARKKLSHQTIMLGRFAHENQSQMPHGALSPIAMAPDTEARAELRGAHVPKQNARLP